MVYLIFVLVATNKKIYNALSLNKKLHVGLLIVSTSLLFGSENTINAIKDLVKKKAYFYDIAVKERNQIVAKAPKNSEIIFKPLGFENFPVTICPRDFDPSDTNYIYNYWYRVYWNLDSVTLECKK